MKHTTRYKVLWTMWMTGGGIALAALTYVRTDSVAWTIAALLASSIVLNAIGQAVTQPMHAVRHPRSS